MNLKRISELADQIHAARIAGDTVKEGIRTLEYVRAIEESSFPSDWVLPAERLPLLHEHNPRVFRAVIAEERWHNKLGRAIGSTMIYPIEDDAFKRFVKNEDITWWDMDTTIVRSQERMKGSWATSVFIDVVVSLPRLLGEPLRGFGSTRLLDQMYRHVVEFLPPVEFWNTGELVCPFDDLPRCACCTDDRGVSEALCKRARFRRGRIDRTGMGRRTLDLADYNKKKTSSIRKERIRRIAKNIIRIQNE